MPMRASFMQMASPSPPMPPVTNAMRCVIGLSSLVLGCLVERRSGAFLHVTARCGLDRLVLRVAEALAGRHELPGVRLEPLRPLGPPAARALLRVREPLLRIRDELLARPVAALVL